MEIPICTLPLVLTSKGTRLRQTPYFATMAGSSPTQQQVAARACRDGAWGATPADYDLDGDDDLYVTRWGRNALLRNEGRGALH